MLCVYIEVLASTVAHGYNIIFYDVPIKKNTFVKWDLQIDLKYSVHHIYFSTNLRWLGVIAQYVLIFLTKRH